MNPGFKCYIAVVIVSGYVVNTEAMGLCGFQRIFYDKIRKASDCNCKNKTNTNATSASVHMVTREEGSSKRMPYVELMTSPSRDMTTTVGDQTNATLAPVDVIHQQEGSSKRMPYVELMTSSSRDMTTTGGVRLVGGSGPYEGRVEIFMNGEWGTVDDDPWDNDDSGVVCRQLGYFFGGIAYSSAHFGEGSGPIWLDGIRCAGTESTLLSCSHQTDTSEDSHAEDVGVACNGEVRLAGGSGSYEGRVEIFMNGQWGTVDEDPWDNDDAGVVCRQLGYLFGGVAYRSAHFGEGSGPIWLDEIACIGDETHLLNCSHQTDTSEDSHSEDVGVACNGEGI